MKLETKYGVLEGTVEEFKELLEGKKDLSYFTGRVEGKCRKEDKPEYYVVNNDSARCYVYPERHIPKGLVLKHKVLKGYNNFYTDTTGTDYMLDDKDLDDYNKIWVDGKFKSYKDKGILLIQKEEEYKVVKEDLYAKPGDIMLEKGTVLLKSNLSYEDSLGREYFLFSDTVEDKLVDICDYSTGFHFEGNKRNNKLFKVGLPQNQF